jgi:hypothetical protein
VSARRAGTAGRLGRQAGFGMVELVVAMTLLAVGVLGLAAAAALASRSLNSSAASDRATRAVAAVLDSLVHVGVPSAGERTADGVTVRWVTQHDSALVAIRATVEVSDPHGTRRIDYHAIRMRHARE